jgi:hypothetical protein
VWAEGVGATNMNQRGKWLLYFRNRVGDVVVTRYCTASDRVTHKNDTVIVRFRRSTEWKLQLTEAVIGLEVSIWASDEVDGGTRKRSCQRI